MSEKPSPALAAVLKPLAERKRFGRGEFLFRAGESVKGFYHVVAGEIRVFRMDEQGREIEVTRLGPGDILAEAVMFAAKDYPAFAQAVGDSECQFFGKEKVLARVENDPRVAKAFLILLAQKCLALNRRIEALSLRTVRQRLAQFLLSRHSGARGSAVDLGMKKSELARLLGTAGETLSRTLRQMTRDGLIKVRGRSVAILDLDSLRGLLGD